MMGRKAKQHNRRTCAGYTLIELVLAVLVVGIIAGSVLSTLSFNEAGIVPPGKTLEQAIRSTRSFPGYIIERSNVAGMDNHYRVYFKDADGREVEISTGYLPEGVHMRPTFSLSFNGLGQPMLSGTIITSSLDIELYNYTDDSNPDQTQVNILGKVHVERNTGTVWAESP